MDFIHQLLPPDTLQALGWTVLHSLWQAFVVALLLAAYLLALQKTDARKRYIAGNTALLTTLLLAVGTFVYYLEKSKSQLASLVYAEDGTVLGRFFLNVGIADEYPAAGDIGFFQAYFNENMPLIVTVWLVGMVFFMLKMLGGLLYVQRLKTRMTSPLSKEWQERMAQLSAELGINRQIKLLESALAKAPMVVGWLKPMVLMPIGAVNHLTTAQVEAILAHELAHVARHDYLLNLLQSCIEILFYFNPAVWWISGNVRTERENCCDDIAVRLCGNSLAYAKALVSLQELQLTVPSSLAMPFSRSRSELLLRIQRILQPSQNKSNVMEKLSATLLLTVAVVLLSVQANTPFGDFINKVVAKGLPMTDALAPIAMSDSYLAQTDTIPDETHDGHVHFNTDDEDIEFKMKNDKITFLKIDGEVIPEERYSEYEGRVREILADVPAPPDAPEAPEMPGFPAEIEAPAPPAPPSFHGRPAPPAPPAPSARTRKITTQKDRNGTTFIIETEDGGEPVEIVVKDGKKGTIIVNGQEIAGLKKGDKTIIMQDVPGSFFWNGEQFEGLGADNFHFDAHGFPGFTPDAFAFDMPAMAWDGLELQALQERLRSGNYSQEWAEDYARRMQEELSNSEEWQAELEAQRARMLEEYGRSSEEHQRLLEDQRAVIEREVERAQREARVAQERAQKDMERQLKQMEKELQNKRRSTRSGSM